MASRLLLVALVAACGAPQLDERETERPPSVAADANPSTVADATPPPRAEYRALVERAVTELASLGPASTGVSVGLVIDGKEHYFGFGEAWPGKGPPTADTLFHIASLTKPHTVLLVAMLVADGTLALDDPVARCRRRRPAAFCGRAKTTLRHLLSHSAGLRIVPKNAGGPYSPADLVAYLDKTRPRDATPGKSFRYSTTGFGAVALLVSKRTRRSFSALLGERVLDPIGSKATMELSASAARQTAQGYNRRGEASEAGPTRQAFMASGGLIASARDLVQLLSVYADPESHPAFAKAVAITREQNTGLTGFHGSAVALGWLVERELGIYWHPGVSSVHRTVIAYDPEQRTGVAILVNRFVEVGDRRVEDAAFAILRGLR